MLVGQYQAYRSVRVLTAELLSDCLEMITHRSPRPHMSELFIVTTHGCNF